MTNTGSAVAEIKTTDRRAVAGARDDVPASESTSLLAVIERVALNPAADIDKLERLLLMQERIMARNAEEAFNDALNAAQMEMSPIAANSYNKQTKSKYATYDTLDNAVRPIYTKHGFSLSFNSGEGAPVDHVRVECFVSRGGHTRTYRADMSADGKGAKGGDVMTKTHATGSAFTYGQRYLLGMIFNLAVSGKRDDDGNGASEGAAFVTSEQVEELKALIDKAVEGKPGTDHASWMTSFLEYMGADALNAIKAKDFGKGKTAIVNAMREDSKK